MKKIFILIVLSLTTINSFAQHRELGLMAGGCFYLGDINPTVPFLGTRPALGAYYRKHSNYRWAHKFSALYGSYYASDANSSVAYQKLRNLDVKSKVLELSGQIEFNYLMFHGDDVKYFWSPYVFVGIGAFGFNPKGSNGNDWVKLQKVKTEAQGTGDPNAKSSKYKRIQPCIPIGVGVRYSLNRFMNFSMEWGMRKTFTDYLDDVSGYYPTVEHFQEQGIVYNNSMSDKSIDTDPAISNSGRQRGNFRTKDWYSFCTVSLSFKLKDPNGTCPAFK